MFTHRGPRDRQAREVTREGPEAPYVLNHFKFPLQLHQKYDITQYEELGFSYCLLRWKIIILPILTTSLVDLSLKSRENVLFDLGSEWVTLPLARVINFKFPLQPHQKYYVTQYEAHSMKKLAFHSLLRWKLIMLPILTTSRLHLSLKGWENSYHDRTEVYFANILLWQGDEGPSGAPGRSGPPGEKVRN